MPFTMEENKWEKVVGNTTLRLKVPGGWLYIDTEVNGMVFVPDPTPSLSLPPDITEEMVALRNQLNAEYERPITGDFERGYAVALERVITSLDEILNPHLAVKA